MRYLQATKDIVNAALSQALYFSPEKFSPPLPPRHHIQQRKDIRVALVKQDVYTNLYCAPTGASFSDLLDSSLRHTGPAALLKQFECDFHIVKVEPDVDCQIWRQKICDCGQGDLAYYEAQRGKSARREEGETWIQGDLAKSVDEIDWASYDIIVSIDISIPTRIVKRFPRVLWCYYVSEPCMRSYRQSRGSPLAGYDIFLNQRFAPRLLGKPADHEIDFPFAFQYSGLFDDLQIDQAKNNGRCGIFIEAHTERHLSKDQRKQLERFGPVRTTTPSTLGILASLLQSRYFIRLGGRRLWGNSMVEAIACGAIALGNPGEYKNRSLFNKATKVRTFRQLLEALEKLEADDSYRTMVGLDQQRRLDHFCFQKPLDALLTALDAKRGST